MIRKLLISASLLMIAFFATIWFLTRLRGATYSYARGQTFREFRFERGKLLLTTITRWAFIEPVRIGGAPELVLPENWLMGRDALPLRSGLVAFYETSSRGGVWPFSKSSGGMRVVRAVSGFGGDPNAGDWVQSIVPAQLGAELLPPLKMPTTNRIVMGGDRLNVASRLDSTSIRQTVDANALGNEVLAATKYMDVGWRTEKTRSWTVAALPALSKTPLTVGPTSTDPSMPSMYKPPAPPVSASETPSYSLTPPAKASPLKSIPTPPPMMMASASGVIPGTVQGQMVMGVRTGISTARLFGAITNPYDQIVIPIWVLIVFAFIPEMVLAVMAVLRFFRRRARRRRGECTACGYDLRGNPESACPECGFGSSSVAPEPA